MKRTIPWALALICILTLAGCGKSGGAGNTLLDNASPETSALTLYACDGETVTVRTMYDAAVEEQLLSSLSAVPAEKAEDWSPEQVTLPVYGLEIGGKDGYSVEAAWSNGYWIAADGSAYRFQFDFGTLAADYEWRDEDRRTDATFLPCMRLLCQNGDSWRSDLLTPAQEPSAPEGISIELVRQSAQEVTVALTNSGQEEWTYGEHFYLDVLLDGTWYAAPPIPGSWGFNDIGLILPAGETREKSYDLTMYGELPAGRYRLVTSGGPAAEFDVER